MRRADREVRDKGEILEILRRCEVAHVAFFDGEYPYVVPLNFGCSEEGGDVFLYFHCALSGKKLELLKKNPNVAFSCCRDDGVLTAEEGCDFTVRGYESAAGTGKLEILPEDEKKKALEIILKQYTGGKPVPVGDKKLPAVYALKLTVSGLTAKRKLVSTGKAY